MMKYVIRQYSTSSDLYSLMFAINLNNKRTLYRIGMGSVHTSNQVPREDTSSLIDFTYTEVR